MVDANPGAKDNVRKLLSLVLAINDLSNTTLKNLKKKLMAKRGMNWDEMTRNLGAKYTLLNRRSVQYAIILRVAHIQLLTIVVIVVVTALLCEWIRVSC